MNEAIVSKSFLNKHLKVKLQAAGMQQRGGSGRLWPRCTSAEGAVCLAAVLPPDGNEAGGLLLRVDAVAADIEW